MESCFTVRNMCGTGQCGDIKHLMVLLPNAFGTSCMSTIIIFLFVQFLLSEQIPKDYNYFYDPLLCAPWKKTPKNNTFTVPDLLFWSDHILFFFLH